MFVVAVIVIVVVSSGLLTSTASASASVAITVTVTVTIPLGTRDGDGEEVRWVLCILFGWACWWIEVYGCVCMCVWPCNCMGTIPRIVSMRRRMCCYVRISEVGLLYIIVLIIITFDICDADST